MKIVLDESVPHDLAKALRRLGCDIVTFPNAWKGTNNGQLLALISQAGFGCLLTCDKNMSHQQNLRRLQILIAVLPTQRLEPLLKHADRIADMLGSTALPAAGVLPIDFG